MERAPEGDHGDAGHRKYGDQILYSFAILIEEIDFDTVWDRRSYVDRTEIRFHNMDATTSANGVVEVRAKGYERSEYRNSGEEPKLTRPCVTRISHVPGLI